MRVAVIGIGNEFRCDDGAGVRVADLLGRLAFAGVAVMKAGGEGAALMELWQQFDVVILVDAMQSGGAAGSVRCFPTVAETLPLEASFSCSSHALGIVQAVRLAGILDRLPQRLILYGIEGNCFDYGCDLSPAVEAGVAEAVALITSLLHSVPSCRTTGGIRSGP